MMRTYNRKMNTPGGECGEDEYDPGEEHDDDDEKYSEEESDGSRVSGGLAPSS